MRSFQGQCDLWLDASFSAGMNESSCPQVIDLIILAEKCTLYEPKKKEVEVAIFPKQKIKYLCVPHFPVWRLAVNTQVLLLFLIKKKSEKISELCILHLPEEVILHLWVDCLERVEISSSGCLSQRALELA